MEGKHRFCLKLGTFCIIQILFHSVSSSSEWYRCPSHLPRNYHLKTFRDKCYFFMHSVERTWIAARDDCYNNHGHGKQVMIPDEGTQKFVYDSIKQLNWNKNGVWIGGYKENGIWKWVSGVPMTWTKWDEGQPDGRWFPVIGDEECAQMRFDDNANGRWHDYRCDNSLQVHLYICQYNMGPATTTTTTTTTAAPTTTRQSTSTITTKHITSTATVAPTTPSKTTKLGTSSGSIAISSTTELFNLTVDAEKLQAGSDNLSGGAVAGIAVTLILIGFIAVGVLLLLVFYRRRNKKYADEPGVLFDNGTYSVEQRQCHNEFRGSNCNHYDEISQTNPGFTKGSQGVISEQHSNVNVGDLSPNPDNSHYDEIGAAKASNIKNQEQSRDSGNAAKQINNIDNAYSNPYSQIDSPDEKAGACADIPPKKIDDDYTADLGFPKENHYDLVENLQFGNIDLSKKPMSYNNNLYNKSD